MKLLSFLEASSLCPTGQMSLKQMVMSGKKTQFYNMELYDTAPSYPKKRQEFFKSKSVIFCFKSWHRYAKQNFRVENPSKACSHCSNCVFYTYHKLSAFKVILSPAVCWEGKGMPNDRGERFQNCAGSLTILLSE